ncbi:transmembrane emp24 domain-containing protein 9-like [Chelmon rostratus]|uniref:transmembrane emp24 domain-containing protein 9-like n=1 Tax=Chelmon rostratus TaxID=109905 RepID=UPI001BE5DF29|nr:transmembrane emp24 domain-containing protein 9-like [Chelmon rostratus]
MAPVRMQSCMLTVLLLSVFCSFVSSLYFHLGQTEKKCFLQEIPDDTMLVGNFQTQLYDEQKADYLPSNQDLWMFVEAKDPDDKLVLSRSYVSQGTFRFTTLYPGRYQICLQSDPSQRPLSAGGMLTVHLNIRLGEQANNYTEIAARDKLTELQLRVRQLAEQVQQIQKEQQYQRVREKHFREVNHNTSMWIFWWPVVRSLYVVAIITWSTNSW